MNQDKCPYKRECKEHRPVCDFMNYHNCKHYQAKQERNEFGYPRLCLHPSRMDILKDEKEK